MTTTKLTTAEQFGEIHEDGRFDLIDGEVYRVSPTQSWHGIVSGRLALALGMFAMEHGGESPTAEPGFQVANNPDSVLCPDACYVSSAKMAGLPPGTAGWFPFAPDIAAEVLSPSETRRTTTRTIELYLAAGSTQVWVVDVRKETLTVHTRDAQPRVYKRDEILEGGDALPGFSLEIPRIFR